MLNILIDYKRKLSVEWLVEGTGRREDKAKSRERRS